MRSTKLTRLGSLFISALYALAIMWLPFSATVSAANLPADYTLTPVANNLDYPTNTAWLPDGTMLVAEKVGIVRAVRNGAVQAQPFIDISSSTNDYWDKGLLGMAVDPEYNTNHYIYLMRTYENGVGGYEGTKVNQLVRVTINAANTQMIAGSLVVLVGKDTPGTCESLAVTADCMPSDSPSHSVGDVMFAPDGTIFLTAGDGASFTEVDTKALRSQNLDSLAGKMLHIDRDGKGLPGNPFYNGNASANRSKVWAYGFRNPWRITFKPGTTTPYVTDVGWDSWEEVNVAAAGGNYGWPCYEGNGQQGGYAQLSSCQQLYTKVNNGTATVKQPLTAWDHNAGSAAAVGGAFVTGSQYPASLQGAYLYGDYAYGWARMLRTNDANALTAGPNAFSTNMPSQVNIEQGPDGSIYIVSIADESNAPGTGKIYRLDYNGNTPPPPPVGECNAGEFRAEYFNNQTLNGAAALTRCEAAPLDHDWALGNPGTGVNNEQFSARYSGNFTFNAANYKFDAWADDGVRVYVDGQLVVDGWKDQAFTHYTGSKSLAAGTHAVVVEFYDAFEDAAVKVQWAQDGVVTPPTPNECAAGQFKAEYFNALTPGGTAALTRCENAPLAHDWQFGSPGTGVNNEVFSARYSGNFDFQQGQYKFEATADDGVRIFVDGNQVLNGWFDQAATHYEAAVNMAAGTHAIVVEYYDKLEDAIVQAGWTQLGGNTAPVATISTPAATSSSNIGATVNFSGSATDAQDGTLPGSALTWSVVIQHCNLGQCHSHFLQQFNGAAGSFTYPDHGQDEYYIELKLFATDSQGATSAVKTVRIDPIRPPAQCPSDWYVAEYFNNKTLSGAPVATACMQTVDNNWLYGSPLAGVNDDNFSARFTTTQNFLAGSYRFSATGDDGVRLFIDDALLLDGWKDQAETTYSQNQTMAAGTHSLKLEFYDATEDAVVRLNWVKL